MGRSWVPGRAGAFIRGLAQQATAVVVVAICLALFTDAARDLFIYRRDGFLAGEYWRIVSGHFVHITAPHLLLNLAAWLLIWVYGRSVCAGPTWAALLFFCALGSGAGLVAFSPEVEWYTGLSGVLHGLLIAVAVLRLSACRGDYAGWFILAVVAVKLGYEHFQGPTPVTADWVGLRVIFEAHWYGAVSGVLVVTAIGLIRAARRRRAIARA